MMPYQLVKYDGATYQFDHVSGVVVVVIAVIASRIVGFTVIVRMKACVRPVMSAPVGMLRTVGVIVVFIATMSINITTSLAMTPILSAVVSLFTRCVSISILMTGQRGYGQQH